MNYIIIITPLLLKMRYLSKNSNLSEIEDIEYIQKKLLAALRVPKAFLGFDEATGEGKNLAILDIRFARAVHRIQKALIQELNKMAIIHLYLKGFEDELNNFTLSLTTPSTQADLLKNTKLERKRFNYIKKLLVMLVMDLEQCL